MIDRNVTILSLVLRNAHGNWEKNLKKKRRTKAKQRMTECAGYIKNDKHKVCNLCL